MIKPSFGKSFSFRMKPKAPVEGNVVTASEKVKNDVKKMRSHLRSQQDAARRASRGLINPEDSKFMRWWDLITTSALVYTATVTPIEIAFFPSDSPGWNMTPEEL
jgi:hypothetical protein